MQPDLAGWRRERLPQRPRTAEIAVAPDWVCEVLSPSTETYDRGTEAPLYEEHGVAWLWLVDTATQTVEVQALEVECFRPVGTWRGDGPARTPPFDAVELALADSWAW